MSKAEKPSTENAQAPKPADGAEAPAKKKPPVKLIGIVAGLMIAEGAGVFVFVGATARQPSAAKAGVHGEQEAEQDALVEIEVSDDKFQNMSTGRVWIWDMSMFVKVRKKDEEYAVNQLGARKAEVAEGVAQIMRRAQHADLKEPGLETLNRQLAAYMSEILGHDAEGNPRVVRIVLPKCRGFPADF